jgi:hypothetical protein|tara:strand:- start:1655 stop:1900 length:246 start_codon:yes stop_codon:yes gene_type:complete
MSEDPKVLEMVRETLEESVMVLAMPYSELKRLERMDIKTIRDFRDFDFVKEEEDESLLDAQKHIQTVFFEREWNDIEEPIN